MFVVRPELVLFPRDSKDVQILVQLVATFQKKGHQFSLVPRSAGTCMSGGSIGESIIMDVTRYMNRVKEVTHDHATVQPGCFYRDFEKETLKQGVLFPSYTASRELCALGGMFANDCAGEKTLKYGKFHDYIIASKVIFTDGNEYVVTPLTRAQLERKIRESTFEAGIYRSVWDMVRQSHETITTNTPQVSKNSAGYALWRVWNEETGIFDLNQLLVGSQGTLGIIVEMTLRMVPVEPMSAMMVTFLPDLSRLGDLVNLCKTESPTSIESFDRYSLSFAFRFFSDFIKQLGLWGGFRLGLQFIPELFMMIRSGGIPQLILMTEISGSDPKELQQRLLHLRSQVREQFGYTSRVLDHQGSQKYWRIRRESFNLLRKHVQGLHTAPCIDDVVVPVTSLPEFMPEIQKILDAEKFIYTIAGHAGNGNFHIIPLLDFKKEGTRDQIMRLSDTVYELVHKYHGSITGEHNDGIVRTPYLGYMFSDEMIRLFEKVKEVFDPQVIFNPGKKVGGTKEYLYEHIIRE
jgi:FAD/FMN-containing dehydrogenase